MPKRDGKGETEANTKGGTEEAKGGEEMKQKITNAEAVQAADTLRKFCNQFAQKSCYGCPFYWKDAPMQYNSCRLDKWPGDYNLRSAKKRAEVLNDADKP